MGRQDVAIAWAMLLGLAAVSWADPFSEVPAGHWAYGACSRLVSCGTLPADRATGFSGKPALTRFEFATAILDPLGEIDRSLRSSRMKLDSKTLLSAAAESLAANPRVTDAEVARAASDLARLGTEFAAELRSLSFDPEVTIRALRLLEDVSAVRLWRAEAFSRPLPLPSLGLAEGLRVPVGHGAVALDYDRSAKSPEILDFLAMSSARLATSSSKGATGAGASFSDPLISRVRTAYEYGLGSAFTLSLGREEISRQGQDKLPLDAASLTSFGIGYRVTPSTSVKVSYSLLDYQNYTSDAPPTRERVAETSVSVEF
jgi:hypothetical protein